MQASLKSESPFALLGSLSGQSEESIIRLDTVTLTLKLIDCKQQQFSNVYSRWVSLVLILETSLVFVTLTVTVYSTSLVVVLTGSHVIFAFEEPPCVSILKPVGGNGFSMTVYISIKS